MLLSSVPASHYVGNEVAFVPFFERLEEASGGRLTVASLDRDIVGLHKQMWAVLDGERIHAVAITETVLWPNDEEWLRVIAYTGDDTKPCPEMMADFLRGAREHGFAGVELYARPGWARILKDNGFKDTHHMMEARFDA